MTMESAADPADSAGHGFPAANTSSGTAGRSVRVYGCAGRARSAEVGPRSTTRPRYITAVSSDTGERAGDTTKE